MKLTKVSRAMLALVGGGRIAYVKDFDHPTKIYVDVELLPPEQYFEVYRNKRKKGWCRRA